MYTPPPLPPPPLPPTPAPPPPTHAHKLQINISKHYGRHLCLQQQLLLQYLIVSFKGGWLYADMCVYIQREIERERETFFHIYIYGYFIIYINMSEVLCVLSTYIHIQRDIHTCKKKIHIYIYIYMHKHRVVRSRVYIYIYIYSSILMCRMILPLAYYQLLE